MKFKRLVSLTIAWAFIFMAFTGIILYITPHGRVAYWSDWHLWGLSKTQWGNVHITMGLLMLVSGIFHIYFNWGPIVSYLKNKSRELRVFTPEFNVALLLALLFAGLTLLEAPPLSWVIDLSESIKGRATLTYGEPPYGHAEESRLAVFIRQTGLDEQKSLKRLDEAGIAYEGRGQTILEIALANGLTPKDIFLVMKPDTPAGGGELPAMAPPGLGRMTLSMMSERFGVPLSDLLTALSKAGIEAGGNDTLKGLAANTDDNPRALYETIRVNLGGASEGGISEP